MKKFAAMLLSTLLALSASAQKINISVNGHTLTATLEDNVASRHLVELLQKSNITIDAHDYGGWEKVGSLPESFPSANTQMTTQPGDFVLYSGNQFVLFYGSNSWSYTRFGHIDNVSQSQLKRILGSGDVTITLSMPSATAINSVEATTLKRTEIYSMEGHPIPTTSTESLPRGLYIVRETMDNGTVISRNIRL